MAEPNPAETGEVKTLWVGDLVSAPSRRASSCPARQPPIFWFQPISREATGLVEQRRGERRARQIPPSPRRKLGIRKPRNLLNLFPGFRVEKRALTSQSSPNRRYRATGWRSRICTPASRTSVRPKHVLSSSLFFARATSGRRGASRVPSRARERVDARGKSSAGIGRADRAARPRRAPAPRHASPRSPRPRSAHLENTVVAEAEKTHNQKLSLEPKLTSNPLTLSQTRQARSGA